MIIDPLVPSSTTPPPNPRTDLCGHGGAIAASASPYLFKKIIINFINNF
jgi:hypothetical protein